MRHRPAFTIVLFFLYGCIICQEEKPIIAVPLTQTATGAGYYLEMEVGTPGQQVRMLLDLTSSVVSIPVSPWCEANPNCYANQTFFLSESTTPAQVATCTSQCSYCGEITVRGVQQNSCFVVLYYNNLNIERSASIQAVEVTDFVSVQSLSIQTRFAGFFEQSAAFSATDFDGILGMAPYSDFLGLDPWFPTISDSGQVNNQFSFCFSSIGGVLLFGGSDPSLYKGFLSYTSLISSKVYTVAQETFQISGNSLGLTQAELNPTIIDSTSPDTVISNQAYQLVLAKINSLYCSKPLPPVGLCGTKTFFNGYCFSIPGGNLEGYPSFSFILNGNVNLTLEPEDYLIYLTDEGYFCNTLIGATYYQSGTVLGINVLKKYYTTIDLDTQAVGFAKSANCGTAQYIIEYYSGDFQTGPAGKDLTSPFVAIVKRFNDSMPISNVTVTWKITQGGGQISELSATSDSDGFVSATIELGESIGNNIISVSLQNAVGSPIVFTANGVKGIWFYLTNVLSVLALTGGLMAIAWYDAKHGKGGHGHGDKQKKVETFSDLVNDTDNEKVTLLEWARLHDQPVREPNQTAVYHSQVYSQRTR